MKYLIMDWFGKFQCIGGECSATCCSGWNIKIDEESIEKYEKLKAEGEELFADTYCNENNSMRMVGQSCLFLTEDGWCKLVRNYGEDILCDTCKIYPRMCNVYGDVNECTVKISCPVVADYLLSEEEIAFIYSEDDKEKDEEYDYVVYDAMSHIRSYIVDLMQEYREYPLAGRLFCALDASYKVEKMYQKEELTIEKTDELLKVLRDTMYLDNVCSQVQELDTNFEVKRKCIVELLQLFFATQPEDKKADKNSELRTYLQEIQNNPTIFYEDLDEFTKVCSEYERMYENYFIYQYFAYFMPDKKKTFRWRMAVLEFCYIQLLAMIAWKREKKLSKTQYRDIIVFVARKLEHNDIQTETINKLMKENDFEDVARLWMCLVV